jgi:hypothetical protein
MRAILSLVGGLVFLAAARADDPDAGALVKDLLASQKETVEVLKLIKDSKSAEAARAQLDRLGGECQRKEFALGRLPPQVRHEALAKHGKERAELSRQMGTECARVEKIKGLQLLLRDYHPFRTHGGEGLRAAARQKALDLMRAVQAYHLTHGELPASLAMLAEKGKDGERPFATADDLLDPWGKPYQYDPAGPKHDGFKPDIWTVDPADGKTKIGNWPQE